MKKTLCILLSILAASAICFVAAGCNNGRGGNEGNTGNDNEQGENNNEQGGNDNEQTGTPAQQLTAQVESAEKTYTGIYAGLTSEAGAASAVSVALTSAAKGEVTYDDVVEIINSSIVSAFPNAYMTLNSYIADIFTYSQLQLKLIDEYDKQSLVGTYGVSYDWSGFDANSEYTSDTAMAQEVAYQKRMAPESASFVGAEEATGKAYITQTHESGRRFAHLEYYLDRENDDMGVTTLNYIEGGSFEYHFCEADKAVIIFAGGTHDEDGNVNLTSIIAHTPQGIAYAVDFGEDRDAVYDYIYSEIARIEGKVEELSSKNAQLAADAGIAAPSAPSVTVVPDFAILKNMLVR